jgi:hypothetical protein
MQKHTDIEGSFSITPRLSEPHVAYLTRFGTTRRMRRDPGVLGGVSYPDPLRLAVGLPIGLQSGYYVGQPGNGHFRCPSVVDTNRPPRGQPSLWCCWGPNPEGDQLVVLNDYACELGPWLRYLIKHFIGPWGYTLRGAVGWREERRAGQRGPRCRVIYAVDNRVRCRCQGYANMWHTLELFKKPPTTESVAV